MDAKQINFEPIQTNQFYSIETKAIENSFNVSFEKGLYFDSFCEHVNECVNEWLSLNRCNYLPIVPIVQSSGHGKTRYISEI